MLCAMLSASAERVPFVSDSVTFGLRLNEDLEGVGIYTV